MASGLHYDVGLIPELRNETELLAVVSKAHYKIVESIDFVSAALILGGFSFWFCSFLLIRLYFDNHVVYSTWSWQYKVVWQQKIVGLCDCFVTFVGAFYTLATQNLHLEPVLARSFVLQFFLCAYMGYLLYDFMIRCYYYPIRDKGYLFHHVVTFSLCYGVLSSLQAHFFAACMLAFLFGDALIFLRLIINNIPELKDSFIEKFVYYAEYAWYFIRIAIALQINQMGSQRGLYAVYLGQHIIERNFKACAAIPISINLNLLTVLFVYWLIIKTKIILSKFSKSPKSIKSQ